jgi:hypothetical protein
MGLLKRAIIIRRYILKISTIDNPDCSPVMGIKGIVVTKKIILIPFGSQIIPSGGLIPHIKSISGLIYKYCPKCKSWQCLSSFCKNKSSVDGYKDKCKKCDNEIRRARYAKTKAIT